MSKCKLSPSIGLPVFRTAATAAFAALPFSGIARKIVRPNMPVIESVLRPMHATAETFLVTASDGAMYVMRVPEGSDPGHHLFREALGSLLGTYLGLPMMPWSPLLLKAQSVESLAGGQAEDPIFFGSKVPETPGPLYEYLPSSWTYGTDVAIQMVRMQVFDYWIAHFVRRQFIAFRQHGSETLQIQFIRNTSILSRPNHPQSPTSPLSNPYYTARRLGVEADCVHDMVDRISCLTQDTLKHLVGSMPRQWVNPKYSKLALASLAERKHEILQLHNVWSEAARRV